LQRMPNLLDGHTNLILEVDWVGNVVPVKAISHFLAVHEMGALVQIGVLT
jgi:hypothetical protein